MSLQKDIYLVIGGSSCMLTHRRTPGEGRLRHSVSVLDIVQRHRNVPFYTGNATNKWDVLNLLKKCQTKFQILKEL
ncbi:hypothetical protein BKA82DRAFT_369797 [Pisolithus tinctorius]|uniref:Uncharacterized protein n=1 Tax=Pisolithus tinctorius Marx 270 TaxID=870435 RepID=A0A0C3NH71_PISTI|nr:hypothetical protein BKA82DRAFT_369797 [Pisolithus tinctorius]KIN94808.1 hypothetical protein M404DRAFT_369797 [Pisolithus tinctorius Marx 270]